MELVLSLVSFASMLRISRNGASRWTLGVGLCSLCPAFCEVLLARMETIR